MDQLPSAFTSNQKENQGERKAIERKAEERRAHEPAPTNVAFRAAWKIFMHKLSPAGPRMRRFPSLGECKEAAASMSPRKRGMMPGYPDTLGRSAWLHVGFRETSLSPSGRDSELEDPSLGRNNVRSHQSDPPKTMMGRREAAGVSQGLPSLDQELVGTWHWALAPKSHCSSGA